MSKKWVEEFTSQTPNPELPEVKDISPEDVKEHQNACHLIDVRRPDEYKGEFGHISGAQLLTLDELPQKVSDLPKDETIVFICRSGRRSAQASSFALENGFQSVYNMAGGMIAWTEKGFQAEDKN